MRNFNIYKFVVVAIISVAIIVALVVANTTKPSVEVAPEVQEEVNAVEEVEPIVDTDEEIPSNPAKAVNTEVTTASAKKPVTVEVVEPTKDEKADEVEQPVVEEPVQPTQTTQYGGGRYASIANSITQQEKDYIARLAFLEARGESDEGQRAVIEVILNRVLSGSFPNTIDGVIFQSGQFTPANRIYSTTATPKEYNNLEFVLSGQAFQTDVNVVFFSTGLQQGRALYKKIGNHYFQYL